MKLTKDDLNGIWADVPISWDEDYALDEPALRDNLRRLADDGIDCLYVNGTASEFYAQSWEDFQQIVDVFLDELKGRGVRTQIGRNATYTDGVIRMIDYVISRSADGV